ncbi:MAG: hypothetical protein KC425_14945 [Anaerolineales bacterium]|nr:hypothetical protein [Anaerolineales bacterium]
MPTYSIGESFPAQFAWRLPDGDYIRAVFQADVLDLVPPAEKYVVRLSELLAGRQEDPDGNLRPTADFDQAHWALVGRLVGRKITVAYEIEDGRALHMRLETLTGEHNYFFRYEMAEDTAQRVLEKWQQLPKDT